MADIELGITNETVSDDEEESEALTAAEVLQKLEEALLDEKFCPELLEHKMEVVECMMEQVEQMETNISHAKTGDFKVSIHRMEIDRIRYILSSYLRIRLKKIEQFTSHILQSEKTVETPRLSPEELVYANEYETHLEDHFRSVALRHMPPNLQSIDTKQMAVRPNLDSYVFVTLKEDVEGLVVEAETVESGEEIIDLQKGDQHIMRYQPIAALVSSGAASLI